MYVTHKQNHLTANIQMNMLADTHS